MAQNKAENGYCHGESRAYSGMYTSPQTEYDAADSTRMAATVWYVDDDGFNARTVRWWCSSLPAMRHVARTLRTTLSAQ